MRSQSLVCYRPVVVVVVALGSPGDTNVLVVLGPLARLLPNPLTPAGRC